jgi:hypothetical protein
MASIVDLAKEGLELLKQCNTNTVWVADTEQPLDCVIWERNNYVMGVGDVMVPVVESKDELCDEWRRVADANEADCKFIAWVHNNYKEIAEALIKCQRDAGSDWIDRLLDS